MADRTLYATDSNTMERVPTFLHGNADGSYSPVTVISGGGTSLPVVAAPFPASTAHAAISAAGSAVSITLAAVGGQKHKIPLVVAGYDAAPAAASTLKVVDNGGTVLTVPITAAGPLFIPAGIQSAAGSTSMVFTMSAGGGSVVAYLNIPGARTEA